MVEVVEESNGGRWEVVATGREKKGREEIERGS